MAGNRRSRAQAKPDTQRLNAQVRKASLTRLMVHVVMAGRNPGEILSDLIDAHLRDYAIPATLVGRANKRDRTAEATEISLAEPVAA